ncbi:MAG: hypothetical protein J6T38_04620 [Bacteroidaceae bacterium]|jgi:hypothetical protein|nr:hypothetical protein [Bacteroidaceae bacterium]
MQKAYIKPKMESFDMEVEGLICNSPLTYEEGPVVGPTNPVLSKEFDFEEEDLNFGFDIGFGLGSLNFPQ